MIGKYKPRKPVSAPVTFIVTVMLMLIGFYVLYRMDYIYIGKPDCFYSGYSKLENGREYRLIACERYSEALHE